MCWFLTLNPTPSAHFMHSSGLSRIFNCGPLGFQDHNSRRITPNLLSGFNIRNYSFSSFFWIFCMEDIKKHHIIYTFIFKSGPSWIKSRSMILILFNFSCTVLSVILFIISSSMSMVIIVPFIIFDAGIVKVPYPLPNSATFVMLWFSSIIFKISSFLKMFPKLFLLACHYLLFSFWILRRSYNYTHYFLYNNCYINTYGNLYIWNITIVIIEVDYNDRYIRTYITKINYLHQSKFECLMHQNKKKHKNSGVYLIKLRLGTINTSQ